MAQYSGAEPASAYRGRETPQWAGHRRIVRPAGATVTDSLRSLARPSDGRPPTFSVVKVSELPKARTDLTGRAGLRSTVVPLSLAAGGGGRSRGPGPVVFKDFVFENLDQSLKYKDHEEYKIFILDF